MMEQREVLEKRNKLLQHLSDLPRKMLKLEGNDNITEFVLHDLCNEACLNLQKAAYFVDNPDFNCTKGITGFSKKESCDIGYIWDNPQDFSAYMRESSFNKKVRNLSRCSLKKSEDVADELAKTIAHDLGFENYAFCTWDLKNNNHGFVVYERGDNCDVATQEYILNGMSLLSFCPIF